MFSWLFFDEKHYFVLGGKPNQVIQYDAELVFSELTEISLEEATSGKYRMFQGMFLGTDSQTDDFEQRFAEELCQRFSGVRSQPVIYEAMPLGTTKATALSRLAEILKIDSSEIMAMGDANNDIEMLQFAGLVLQWEMPAIMSNLLRIPLQQQRRRRCCACDWEIYFIIKKPSSCQLGFIFKNS